MCISDYIQTTFCYLGRFLKKLADDQCTSITKGSIYTMFNFEIRFDVIPAVDCVLHSEQPYKSVCFEAIPYTTHEFYDNLPQIPMTSHIISRLDSVP